MCPHQAFWPGGGWCKKIWTPPLPGLTRLHPLGSPRLTPQTHPASPQSRYWYEPATRGSTSSEPPYRGPYVCTLLLCYTNTIRIKNDPKQKTKSADFLIDATKPDVLIIIPLPLELVDVKPGPLCTTLCIRMHDVRVSIVVDRIEMVVQLEPASVSGALGGGRSSVWLSRTLG